MRRQKIILDGAVLNGTFNASGFLALTVAPICFHDRKRHQRTDKPDDFSTQKQTAPQEEAPPEETERHLPV